MILKGRRTLAELSPRGNSNDHKWAAVHYIRITVFILFVLIFSFTGISFKDDRVHDEDLSTILRRDTYHNSSQIRLSETEEKKIISGSVLKRATDYCDKRVLTKKSRRNWGDKSYSNRHLFEQCTFNPIEEGGPIPTLFLVNGRSGSDVTWTAITTLAGGVTPIGEHTGANKVKTKEFLGAMSEEEGAWWVTEHLCEFTRRYCNKPVVGFKWKPFVDSWNLPATQGMLKKIASFDEPKIKVIFMTRNPLDVLISKQKHKTQGAGAAREGVKAHCKPDEEDCIKLHAAFGKGLTLPSNGLIKKLQESTDAFDLFDTSLLDMGITYLRTSYEKLYDSEDAEEWMRIFKFLGRGPTHNLTLDRVTETLPFVQTSPKTHLESLSNFAEIQSVLNGTDFEKLLH